MTEFKIGSKWLLDNPIIIFHGQEVEIIDPDCTNNCVIVESDSQVRFAAAKHWLKPIPPKSELKVRQDVWVKAKIMNIDGNYLELQFSPHVGTNIEINSKYTEIKPCEPEPNYETKQKPIKGNFVSLIDNSIDPQCRVAESEKEPLKDGDKIRIYYLDGSNSYSEAIITKIKGEQRE